jgi:hypothetical protein
MCSNHPVIEKLRPEPCAGGLLHHSNTTSSTNLVDEFLDGMVLPTVAREALRGSKVLVAEESDHLEIDSAEAMDSPLLHTTAKNAFDTVEPEACVVPVPQPPQRLAINDSSQNAPVMRRSTLPGVPEMEVAAPVSRNRSQHDSPQVVQAESHSLAPLAAGAECPGSRVLYGLLMLHRASLN